MSFRKSRQLAQSGNARYIETEGFIKAIKRLFVKTKEKTDDGRAIVNIDLSEDKAIIIKMINNNYLNPEWMQEQAFIKDKFSVRYPTTVVFDSKTTTLVKSIVADFDKHCGYVSEYARLCSDYDKAIDSSVEQLTKQMSNVDASDSAKIDALLKTHISTLEKHKSNVLGFFKSSITTLGGYVSKTDDGEISCVATKDVATDYPALSESDIITLAKHLVKCADIVPKWDIEKTMHVGHDISEGDIWDTISAGDLSEKYYELTYYQDDLFIYPFDADIPQPYVDVIADILVAQLTTKGNTIAREEFTPENRRFVETEGFIKAIKGLFVVKKEKTDDGRDITTVNVTRDKAAIIKMINNSYLNPDWMKEQEFISGNFDIKRIDRVTFNHKSKTLVSDIIKDADVQNDKINHYKGLCVEYEKVIQNSISTITSQLDKIDTSDPDKVDAVLKPHIETLKKISATTRGALKKPFVTLGGWSTVFDGDDMRSDEVIAPVVKYPALSQDDIVKLAHHLIDSIDVALEWDIEKHIFVGVDISEGDLLSKIEVGELSETYYDEVNYQDDLFIGGVDEWQPAYYIGELANILVAQLTTKDRTISKENFMSDMKAKVKKIFGGKKGSMAKTDVKQLKNNTDDLVGILSKTFLSDGYLEANIKDDVKEVEVENGSLLFIGDDGNVAKIKSDYAIHRAKQLSYSDRVFKFNGDFRSNLGSINFKLEKCDDDDEAWDLVDAAYAAVIKDMPLDEFKTKFITLGGSEITAGKGRLVVKEAKETDTKLPMLSVSDIKKLAEHTIDTIEKLAKWKVEGKWKYGVLAHGIDYDVDLPEHWEDLSVDSHDYCDDFYIQRLTDLLVPYQLFDDESYIDALLSYLIAHIKD